MVKARISFNSITVSAGQSQLVHVGGLKLELPQRKGISESSALTDGDIIQSEQPGGGVLF